MSVHLSVKICQLGLEVIDPTDKQCEIQFWFHYDYTAYID